jgi:hypothetical protein
MRLAPLPIAIPLYFVILFSVYFQKFTEPEQRCKGNLLKHLACRKHVTSNLNCHASL